MKLLLCDYCGDIFNLGVVKKQCSCGRAYGNYLDDGVVAEISNGSIPIGFLNSSIKEALAKRIFSPYGVEFTAFIIPETSKTVRYIK